MLILCLGNDMLCDDGVAWAIADALDGHVPPGVTVRRSALSGFYLLDELTGWDSVIVVDAVRTCAHAPGTVLSFPFEALGTEAGPSPHAVGLPTVVALGRRSGVPLPRSIHIVAVEVDDMESFCESLTPAVRAAVPKAVDVIRSLTSRAPAQAGATV
jgi:hydrogenase maturation protease